MSRWRTAVLVLVLWGAGLGAAAQFAKVALFLPELEALYPGRGSTIGFVVSSISLVGVVLGLAAGHVVGRVGARPALVASLVLGAVASLHQATVPVFELMLLSRVVEGFSHLGIVVAAPTLIGVVAPQAWRDASMVLWATFFGVAFAAIGLLGVPLVVDHGLLPLYLAHTAYMLVIAGIVTVALPQRRVTRQTHILRAVDLLAWMRRAYTSSSTMAPAVAWVAYTTTFVALLTVLPTIVGPPARVLVSTVMPLASVVVSLVIGVALLRRMAATHVVAAGFAFAAVVALMLLFVGVSPAGCILLVGALGLVQGATFASIPQLHTGTTSQAVANGAVAQAGNLGNVVGTPLLLAVTAGQGTTGLLMFVMVIWLVGLLGVTTLARRVA